MVVRQHPGLKGFKGEVVNENTSNRTMTVLFDNGESHAIQLEHLERVGIVKTARQPLFAKSAKDFSVSPSKRSRKPRAGRTRRRSCCSCGCNCLFYCCYCRRHSTSRLRVHSSSHRTKSPTTLRVQSKEGALKQLKESQNFRRNTPLKIITKGIGNVALLIFSINHMCHHSSPKTHRK